ncbi:unnamed protein product [Echinostoma caproni]|uniref:Protein-tyrosine phosphatase n=1 Tax=Echinostoma caproni TaxID=27848 RepID=A0A183A988_9TREM|nr:unnamed protein product [Echinostoma caproni]
MPLASKGLTFGAEIQRDPKPEDYINASFIYHIPPVNTWRAELDFDKIDYIATQGPMKSTCGDFWRMIVEQKATGIVMLTNLRDGKQVLCHQYWPEELNRTEEYTSGPVQIKVKLEKEIKHPEVTERAFQVTSSIEPNKCFTVWHLHMTSWPDMGVPDMIQLEGLMDKHQVLRRSNELEGPTVVHCRAGLGRTGTFIVSELLRKHVHEGAYVDIAGIILQLRRCRPFMVENVKQYIFLHEYANALISDPARGVSE